MNEKALDGCHKDVSTESFLENLKNAAFLYIDLQELEQTPPKDRNFNWAINYMMMKAACLRHNVSVGGMKKPTEDILNIPARQYIVVVFDEIGTLEAKANKYDFDIHPVAGVVPYNDFFRIIRELCKQDNLFFLVVGKSNGLGIQNYATSVSRVLLLPNRPLVSEFLYSASLRVEELADVLLEYTGGVPDLLTRAVNLLLNNVEDGKEPLSKEECIEVMENNHFQDFCTESFESGLSITDKNTRQSLDILLMMALYHIPFT
eukprot:jgi/Galph1/5047/GphlegSOOS_G3782.1